MGIYRLRHAGFIPAATGPIPSVPRRLGSALAHPRHGETKEGARQLMSVAADREEPRRSGASLRDPGCEREPSRDPAVRVRRWGWFRTVAPRTGADQQFRRAVLGHRGLHVDRLGVDGLDVHLVARHVPRPTRADHPFDGVLSSCRSRASGGAPETPRRRRLSRPTAGAGPGRGSAPAGARSARWCRGRRVRPSRRARVGPRGERRGARGPSTRGYPAARTGAA